MSMSVRRGEETGICLTKNQKFIETFKSAA